MTAAWDDYVTGFHSRHPGITEDVLSRAVDRSGTHPYEWLAAPVWARGPVGDLACGSGPMAPLVYGWTGFDRSLDELGRGARAGRTGVAADAGRLPLPDAVLGSAVMAMALMVLTDPLAALSELRRTLRPEAPLAVLVPAYRPLTTVDLVRYGLLLAVLGRSALPFPRPDVIRRPTRVLRTAGFEVIGDARCRFAVHLADQRDADRFVDSLYLPDISPRRVEAARSLVRSWVGSDIGLPLRRITGRVASR